MTRELHNTTVSKNYVENIIQSMLDTLVVLDGHGVIRTVNRATLNQLGYEESELIGKPFQILIGFPESSPPDKWVNHILTHSAIPYTETTYRDKQGLAIPVLFSSAHISGRGEFPKGIMCLAQDTRERKRAAILLQFSHGLLEAIHQAQNTLLPRKILIRPFRN